MSEVAKRERRERARASLVVAGAAALAVGGCRPSAPAGEDAGATAASAPVVEPDAGVRRPTRRYYLGRNRERCEVYSVDGDAVSEPLPTPCPPDLLVGERIRLAGMTCMREGTREQSRERPVVCPDPLTNAEKTDLLER